ncbi:MAG: (Fe-S)-binding protein, partial [Chloroflexi bacterium]|nr:(Fe-S)-binding protein [Chloroflexota bacterium]
MDQKPEELLSTIDYTPPKKDWLDARVEFKKGTYCYGAPSHLLEELGLPNPRQWQPNEADWKLPENWKETILAGMKERLTRYRSFRNFMDICVRCGACADKCHFFLGTGDPKNMPVLRAELMRSVYRKYFTLSGKLLGRLVGARELTEDVLKEWYYYYHQCTECRRCSVFCPFGIDTAEITLAARELLASVGCSPKWIVESARNSYRAGSHIGIPPHAMAQIIETVVDDIEDVTGKRVEIPINKKGAEVLFITPSADYFAIPGWYTFMGYAMLFHEVGLDYTISSFAGEGGNMGFFHSMDMAKKLCGKWYSEARRLGVKWILGGECGHQWRLVHQYLDTLTGPADFLEEPVSPVTGTRFEQARSAKMVHICEFTADLIQNNKIKLDPSRNDKWKLTFHDSCNMARGMGFFEEPRYIIKNTCNYFYEMPRNTIREQTLCCG